MNSRRLTLFVLVSARISGCGPALGNSPATASSEPQAWFHALLPNSSYPLGPVQMTPTPRTPEVH